jgi:hypothetical protein
MDNGAVLDDGLTYYTVPIDGTIESGTTFSMQFSYNKPDSILTSSQAPVQPVRTATGGAVLTSLPDSNSIMLIGLGLGGALIVLGLVWYVNQRRVAVAQVSSQRRRHTSPAAPSRQRQAVAAAASSETTVYCHQCGKRAGAEDTFCRSCGTKLRV